MKWQSKWGRRAWHYNEANRDWLNPSKMAKCQFSRSSLLCFKSFKHVTIYNKLKFEQFRMRLGKFLLFILVTIWNLKASCRVYPSSMERAVPSFTADYNTQRLLGKKSTSSKINAKTFIYMFLMK